MHAEVNYLAWAVSFLLYYAGGALWYSPVLFGKAWMQAVGISEEKIKENQKDAWKAYFISFISAAVMGMSLAYIIGYLKVFTLSGGLTSGFMIWLGFIFTSMATNSAFAGRPLKLFVIDAGYHLYGLLLMGIILGVWH